MKNSYGSTCATTLFLAVLFCFSGINLASAQSAGGGGSSGGDNIQFANFYPTANTGTVEGNINFLDPNGLVPTTFVFWQESHVINGTLNTVNFTQTVIMYDEAGNQIDSMSFVIPVPALTGVSDWTISKLVTLPTGLYSLEGELEYEHPATGNMIELDTEDEDFIVIN
jgi:hypothetical protein